MIAVCGDTSLLKKSGKIPRSVKVLLYAMKETLSTTHVRWHREHGPGNGRMNVPAYPGSIRIELSSTLRFFVKHGGNISAKVRSKNYRASNLEQGGLEVPITVQCVSLRKKQVMKRLKQLIDKRWVDPRYSNDSEHYN